MSTGTRAPDWYRIEGQNLFWDGRQWLDKAGRVVHVAGDVPAAPTAAPPALETSRPAGRVPSGPFVIGVVSLLAGLMLLFLPAGQQQADNLDLVGAAHTVFVQYVGGMLLAVNGMIWLAAGAVIAYVRPASR